MSFFLIRLLQNFDTIALDWESQAPDSRPPVEWANFPGRKGKEKFWPKSHLTLYSKASVFLSCATRFSILNLRLREDYGSR